MEKINYKEVIPCIDESIDTKDGRDFSVSATLPTNKDEIYRDHGLDVMSMLETTLYDESLLSVCKISFEDMIKEDDEELSFKEICYNIESKGYKYGIANIQFGTLIDDLHDFERVPFSDPYVRTLYKIGKYRNTEIFIDLNRKWDENTLTLIKDDFFNFDIQSDTIHLLTVGSEVPKLVLKTLYNKRDPEFISYKVKN